MSNFFEGAHNTDASHSFFTSNQNQYHIHNTSITHSAQRQSALATLKPVDRSCYYVTPCSSGTREWIFKKIHSWLEDDQAPNILLLRGSPGAGKSTIASTIVSSLLDLNLLGSYFFCKRGDIVLGDPAVIWRTVASDLAQYDSAIADRLVENLQGRKVDPGRADIGAHFKYLVEDPLMEYQKRYTEALNARDNDMGIGDEMQEEHEVPKQRHDMRCPVVVLDALDECGSDISQSDQRRIFLNTIMKWSQLHPSFKLLITSRDERIPAPLRNVCHNIVLETGDLVSPEANNDILFFFQKRFADIAATCTSLPPSWPEMSIIKQLTDRAAGLFIWAETVMRYLEQGFPKQQLNLILSGPFREKGDAIDELYQQILRFSFQSSKAHMLDILKRVVGAIVLAKTPLYRCDLKHFIGKQEDESSIDFILNKLSSVISGRNADGRVRIIHLSFTEFICDSERCGDAFVVDPRTHNQIMVLACLGVMKNGLRFNICQLETSHIPNDDISDLATRVEKAIPSHLSYSCRFWADHLQATTFETSVLAELKSCLYSGFLYWLEVLSLVKDGNAVSQALLLVCQWSKASDAIAAVKRET